jgi:ribonuclease M5
MWGGLGLPFLISFFGVCQVIKEVIVVEGKDDTVAIKRAVAADTIETGGSAIDQKVIAQIKLAQERRGVIVFTDPDHAGERIRKIISNEVPGCKHAYIAKHLVDPGKGSLGVEHASPEAIRESLANLHEEDEDAPEVIFWSDLMAAGLVNHPQAAARREQMGLILGIGYCNGKQFHKRCRMYRISVEEFGRAYAQVKENE